MPHAERGRIDYRSLGEVSFQTVMWTVIVLCLLFSALSVDC